MLELRHAFHLCQIQVRVPGMRVLIVGCGYVGLPLGIELAGLGHEVSGLRRTPAAEPLLRQAGIRPLIGDITRPESLRKLPHAFDWIVNCVASGGGGADDYRALYWQGTRNLVAWLSPARPLKFLYTSSTGVYGQDDGSRVTELSPTNPASATARVLVETEQELHRAVESSGFPAVILRLAGIYGPGRGHWFKQFMAGSARIEGAGSRILNLIHRDDVVGAIVAALERGVPGEVYNVVDDEPVTQLELFKWLSARTGRELPSVAGETADAPGKRRATNKAVSNAKLKSALGYTFKYPTFREGYAAA
jgi:nucleoside-diphosphate-sugar epimerase